MPVVLILALLSQAPAERTAAGGSVAVAVSDRGNVAGWGVWGDAGVQLNDAFGVYVSGRFATMAVVFGPTLLNASGFFEWKTPTPLHLALGVGWLWVIFPPFVDVHGFTDSGPAVPLRVSIEGKPDYNGNALRASLELGVATRSLSTIEPYVWGSLMVGAIWR
jgi:hypothetical protein